MLRTALASFVFAPLALGGDETRIALVLKEPVRLRLRTEVASEVSMGVASATTTQFLEQEAVITPKGEDSATTRLFTVELGPVSGKIELPSLGQVEFGPGKVQKDVDPMLAVTVDIAQRLGGRTVTARVSPTGVVEDVEGDEGVNAGLVIPPELARMGMQAGNGDLVPHVQNFFARLPDAAIKKGATCFVESKTDVRGAEVRFRPLCRMTAVGKDKLGLEMKTEIEASEKSKLPAADKDKPLWSSTSKAVKKATLHVTGNVSLADGLALAWTCTTTTVLEMPNPEGGTLPATNRVKHELARVVGKAAGAKK